MRVRLALLFLVALIAAGGATFVAQNWLSAQRAALKGMADKEAPRPAAEVLVAAANLPTGTFLKSEDLRWQEWPGEAVAEAYFVRGKTMQSADEIVGRVVRQGIAAGEPVTAARTVMPGERGFLAAVLSPGKRAITVPVNATTGIGGFVFPGDRVDLILTHGIADGGAAGGAESGGGDGGAGRLRKASETVLANVRVLAIDQSTNDQTGQPNLAKTVTLEVAPKEAEMVTLITELGRLSLSLRSLTATAGESGGGARGVGYTWDNEVSQLLDGPARADAAAPRPTVRLVLGDVETLIQIK